MKKILASLLALALSISVFATPVFATSTADSFGAETVILTSCTDDGAGGGIYCVLRIAIDVMSVAIGALGVLGIIITGVQYVTAGGSEDKVKKAKKRLIEIVIGLVAYVIAYAVLKWLMPNFNAELLKDAYIQPVIKTFSNLII